jgi:hypothetical protein
MMLLILLTLKNIGNYIMTKLDELREAYYAAYAANVDAEAAALDTRDKRNKLMDAYHKEREKQNDKA